MIVWCLVVLSALATLRTLLIAARYARLFRKRVPAGGDEYTPMARVVLCLRGADPFLRDCIAGLLSQRYEHYELVIVVDSVSDPAWEVAHEAVVGAQIPVTIKPLESRSKHRSLLMSSVLEAVSDLPDECEVVAIADADVLTSPNWLRELVAPLGDPKVGAATGIRWCVPESSEWGTIIRYMWNSFAEPQRHTHQIPWGGSLAVRRDILDVARSERFWQRTFCADLTLTPILSERKLRVQIVPEATSAVRETIDFLPCLSFLSRQMTWVRLYHPRWLAIVADGLLLAAPGCVALLGAIWFLLARNLNGVLLVAAICAAYGAAICVTHFWVEHLVFQIIRRQGGSTSSPLMAWIKCFAAVSVTPLIYCGCCLYAHFRRKVTWRGIHYDYRGPWDIQVQVDAPLEASDSHTTASLV